MNISAFINWLFRTINPLCLILIIFKVWLFNSYVALIPFIYKCQISLRIVTIWAYKRFNIRCNITRFAQYFILFYTVKTILWWSFIDI